MSQSSVCYICLNEDAPLSRITRRSKKNNWLRCDCCKNWLHAECGGYTITEYRKLTKDCWFKCVVCCLQLIRNSSCEGDTDTSSLVTQAVNNRVSGASASASQKISAVNKQVELKDQLNQGSQTRGPRAACGPQSNFMRPATTYPKCQNSASSVL